MLSADNLTEKLSKWHDRMERQYTKADLLNEIANAANVARVGLAAIESFARIGPFSDFQQQLDDLKAEAQALRAEKTP